MPVWDSKTHTTPLRVSCYCQRRRRNLTVPLSPGSRSCHWCHLLCRNQTGWGKCSNPGLWFPGSSSALDWLLLSTVNAPIINIEEILYVAILFYIFYSPSVCVMRIVLWQNWTVPPFPETSGLAQQKQTAPSPAAKSHIYSSVSRDFLTEPLRDPEWPLVPL